FRRSARSSANVVLRGRPPRIGFYVSALRLQQSGERRIPERTLISGTCAREWRGFLPGPGAGRMNSIGAVAGLKPRPGAVSNFAALNGYVSSERTCSTTSRPVRSASEVEKSAGRCSNLAFGALWRSFSRIDSLPCIAGPQTSTRGFVPTASETASAGWRVVKTSYPEPCSKTFRYARTSSELSRQTTRVAEEATEASGDQGYAANATIASFSV